jgi:hypothetical protein
MRSNYSGCGECGRTDGHWLYFMGYIGTAPFNNSCERNVTAVSVTSPFWQDAPTALQSCSRVSYMQNTRPSGAVCLNIDNASPVLMLVGNCV